MTITYTVTDNISSHGGSDRISYGIDVYISTDKDSAASVIASVKDITSDKSKLAALVRKCNDLQLSPIHLYDVIEDLITI